MSKDDKGMTLIERAAELRKLADSSYMRCPFCGCKSASTHKPDCTIELAAQALVISEIPEGWQFVPRAATPEMVNAAEQRQVEGATGLSTTSVQFALWQGVWAAMLEVVPKLATSKVYGGTAGGGMSDLLGPQLRLNAERVRRIAGAYFGDQRYVDLCEQAINKAMREAHLLVEGEHLSAERDVDRKIEGMPTDEIIKAMCAKMGLDYGSRLDRKEASDLYYTIEGLRPASPVATNHTEQLRSALRRLLACINDHKGHGLPTIRDRAECYCAMSEAEAVLGWALADEVNGGPASSIRAHENTDAMRYRRIRLKAWLDSCVDDLVVNTPQAKESEFNAGHDSMIDAEYPDVT